MYVTFPFVIVHIIRVCTVCLFISHLVISMQYFRKVCLARSDVRMSCCVYMMQSVVHCTASALNGLTSSCMTRLVHAHCDLTARVCSHNAYN